MVEYHSGEVPQFSIYQLRAAKDIVPDNMYGGIREIKTREERQTITRQNELYLQAFGKMPTAEEIYCHDPMGGWRIRTVEEIIEFRNIRDNIKHDSERIKTQCFNVIRDEE